MLKSGTIAYWTYMSTSHKSHEKMPHKKPLDQTCIRASQRKQCLSPISLSLANFPSSLCMLIGATSWLRIIYRSGFYL